MPNRIIREGILTSDKVNSLSPEAEVFYRRLLSKVDDHGTFDGRPDILRAALFPLRLDSVSADNCTQWLAECCKCGLLVHYCNKNKPYVQALNTQWVARSAPKNPLFDDSASKCTQLQTSARLVVDVVVVVDVDDIPPVKPEDAEGAKPAKQGPVELDTWLEALGEADAIVADDPIFAYAEKSGVPTEYLHLSWLRFCEDMRERGTRKKDWRAHYRNSVRNGWYKLWWFRDGECLLTTAGLQAQRVAA